MFIRSLQIPLTLCLDHFHSTLDRLLTTNSHNYTCHYKDASSKRQLTFSAGMMSAFEVFYVHILSIQWWRFSPTRASHIEFIVSDCRQSSCLIPFVFVFVFVFLSCFFLLIVMVVIKFINKTEFHFNSIQFFFICLWWFLIKYENTNEIKLFWFAWRANGQDIEPAKEMVASFALCMAVHGWAWLWFRMYCQRVKRCVNIHFQFHIKWSVFHHQTLTMDKNTAKR